MTYLVTGASSGIGYAVASALLQQGIAVIAVARDETRLNRLNQYGSDLCTPVVADLSTEQGIEKLVQSVKEIEALGGVVHAAGSSIPLAAYSQLNAKEMGLHFQVHVATPITLNNRLANKLVDARIVFIDSYSAINLRVGWSGYSIIKSAAQMAAKAAAVECDHSRVIRVFPGAVRTPLVEQVLSSDIRSPVVDLFKQLEATGDINEPESVGCFITNILLNATSEQLSAREYWDINQATDQLFG